MRVLLILVIIFNICPAFAVKRPKWEDVCPQGLHNAKYKEVQWYWPESTKATQELYNYWAQRRIEFNEALDKCDLISESFKESCYENARSKLAVYSELYRLRIENRRITSQVWRDTNKITNPFMFNILSR